MYKYTLLLLAVFGPFLAWAQSTPTSDYSTIYILRSEGLAYSNCEMDILLPRQRAVSLPRASLIKYKIYSSGEIPVSLEYRCPQRGNDSNPSNLPESFTVQQVVDVKPGRDYFLLFHRFFRVPTQEEVARFLPRVVSNTLLAEEDRDFLINDPNAPKTSPNAKVAPENRRVSQGSGFLIGSGGYVLTSAHVVEGKDQVKVQGIKGDFSASFAAEVVALDQASDLALLKINSNLITFEDPPFRLLTSKEVRKAESVFTLGYPMESTLGKEVKVTEGIVSSLSGFGNNISEFQISVPVQPGNSGGPLFNEKGELVGVISAKIRSDVVDQVSYAVKSDYISFFLDQAGYSPKMLNGESPAERSLPDIVEQVTPFIYIVKGQ